MARPRVFISSTYFDLRTIREDLERFIANYGYDSIRHEQGQISYGRDERPEAYAYREIEFCDILIAIVGSRFGTTAAGTQYSISQQELKEAHARGKQVYIFIEAAVHAEFQLYLNNKDVKGVRFNAVNDVRIYSFIEEVYGLARGNPIFPFNTFSDIAGILREQWAGLFQRLLTQEAQKAQTSLVEQLQRSLQTVDEMVQFLNSERADGRIALEEILFSNHPAFEALASLLATGYRVYFRSLSELSSWLDRGMRFTQVEEEMHKDATSYVWHRVLVLPPSRKNATPSRSVHHLLSVSKGLFDSEGLLVPLQPSSWNESAIQVQRSDKSPPWVFDDLDDDIPF